MAHLPPPDPNEDFEPQGIELSEPAAIFLTGPPTPEEGRVAAAILDRRPGALLVVARLS
jgi:hypothetical protein